MMQDAPRHDTVQTRRRRLTFGFAALALGALGAALPRSGVGPLETTPEQLAQFLKADSDRYREAIKEAGIAVK